MVYRTVIYFFVLWTSVYFSNGSEPPDECDLLFSDREWTLDNLKNVTLAEWPWPCLLLEGVIPGSSNNQETKPCPGTLAAQRLILEAPAQFYLPKLDIEIPGNLYEEMILVAARRGNLVLLKYLIDDQAFPMDPYDERLLLQAAYGGNVEMLDYLIIQKNLNDNGESPSHETALHCAAAAGQLDAVRFFVEILHPNVNATTDNGFTPAHYAAMNSFPVLRYLIENGADLYAETEAGENVLHFAAKYDNLASVKYLVEEQNMTIDLQTHRGETPLLYAIQGGSLANVKYFVEERHVDINGTDKMFGRNILHDAAGSTLAVMKYFIHDRKMWDRVNDVDDAGNTPAMEAVKFRSLDILRFLLDELDAKTSMVNKKGYNLLNMAIAENCLPIIKYLADEKDFEIDKIYYKILKSQACTKYEDIGLCTWLNEYGQKKSYTLSV